MGGYRFCTMTDRLSWSVWLVFSGMSHIQRRTGMFDKQRLSFVSRISKVMVLTILGGSILAACGTETPTNTPVAPTAAAAPTTAPAAAPTDTAAPAPAGPTNTAKPAESTGGSG